MTTSTLGMLSTASIGGPASVAPAGAGWLPSGSLPLAPPRGRDDLASRPIPRRGGPGWGDVLVLEVPHSREDHRYAGLVRGADTFVVAHGAAWLDDGADAGLSRQPHVVGEGEKRVRGQYRAGRAPAGGPDGQEDAIDAAGLAGADTEQRPVPRQDDSVGLDVLAHLPGEPQ